MYVNIRRLPGFHESPDQRPLEHRVHGDSAALQKFLEEAMLQRWAGHTKITTTQIYLHTDDEHQKKAVKQLEQWNAERVAELERQTATDAAATASPRKSPHPARLQ